MSNKSSVAALREHLETLFPGKLFSQTNSHRTVLTGLSPIDHGITHGLMRRRIAEWVGDESSGKTTVLRSIISNWCAAGFYVVYIDALNRLVASDWAFVDKIPTIDRIDGQQEGIANLKNQSTNLLVKTGNVFPQEGIANLKNQPTNLLVKTRDDFQQEGIANLENQPTNLLVKTGNDFPQEDIANLENRQLNLFRSPASKKGKFWVVRNLREQDLLWAAEQLVRSSIFDVVILEIGKPGGLNSRAYARLQRALDRSKTAFVLVKEVPIASTAGSTSWGCDSRFRFGWSPDVQCENGLNGATVSISPSIHGTAWRDGLSQNLEIIENAHVSNRLFTHPQVPDRRIPKTRTRPEKETAGVDSSKSINNFL